MICVRFMQRNRFEAESLVDFNKSNREEAILRTNDGPSFAAVFYHIEALF